MRRLQRLIRSRRESQNLPVPTQAASKKSGPVPQPHGVEQWTYQPLNSRNREIRLLQILPVNVEDAIHSEEWALRALQVQPIAVEDAIIQCRIHTVSLNDDPGYVALSYVWGDISVKQEIIIENTRISISANLVSALKAARTRSLSLIWADAISINQDDIHERSEQVQLMNSIFSKATFVVSWLGPGRYSSSGLALSAIKVIMRQILDERKSVQDLSWLQGIPALLMPDEEPEMLQNSIWQAIAKITFHPYWERMWIVQEIAVAERWLIMGGDAVVTKAEFFGFDQFMQHIARRDSNVSVPEFFSKHYWPSVKMRIFNFPTLIIIEESKSLVGADKKQKYNFITFLRNHQATDPRDKVYAFQGLVGNIVQADYSKSTREVYSEYARDWIYCSQDLDLLFHSGRGLGLENKFGLQSWVPDWHRTTSVYDGGKYGLNFTAGRGLADLPQSYPPKIARQFILTVFGTQLDVIKWVFPPCSAHEPENLLRISEELALEKDANGIPLLKVLLRCLTKERDVKTNKRLDMTEPSAFITLALGLYRSLTIGESEDTFLSGVNSIAIKLGLSSELDQVKAILQRISPGMQVPEAWDSMDYILQTIQQWKVEHPALDIFLPIKSRFFRTSDGYLGQGPPHISTEDEIWFLRDCVNPVLLRREGSRRVHVGTCLMVGFMDGEAADLVRNGKLQTETIEII